MTAILTVASVTAGLAVAAVTATAAPALAAVGECPPGSLPGPGNSNPIWTDNNVAVFAGGDFTSANEAAEAEGLVVVEGDASFTRTTLGRFNVGWVGVGSGVAPEPGSVMLAVGGDLSVGLGVILDVGANAFVGTDLLGGNVNVGGATTPDYEASGSRYELNNGVLTQGMGADAVADWSTWGADIASESSAFAALADTGTTSVEFGRVTFTGAPAVTQQVFSITAAALNATPEVAFVGIEDGQSVIINVTGTDAVTWAPTYFEEDGARADALDSPNFGPVSQRTLWNFPQSTSVHIAGSSQVLGSILVPGANPDTTQPTLRVTASTNGRLYTNGSILMDGSGNEHHNYPWISGPFDCVPGGDAGSTGEVSITKIVSEEDAPFLPPGTTFHGTVVCDIPDDGQVIAEWEVAPGETTVVDGLPVGLSCVVEESLGALSRTYLLSPARPALDAPRAFEWNDPAWSINGEPATPPVTFVVPDPGDETQIAITVENDLALGAFTITKAVVNEGDVALSGAFSGSWSCELPEGSVIASGTWELEDGETSDPIAAPLGASCNVSETAPSNPAGGQWGDASISPNPVTITDAAAETPIEITVTNTLTEILGAFTITKVVTSTGTAPAVEFTGGYVCELPAGTSVASGRWSLSAGETTEPISAKIGSVCTVTEDAPAAAAGGTWNPATISPSALTITEASAGEPLEITVTNVFVPTTPGGGGDGGSLPVTGGTVPFWALALGMATVAAGLVLVGARRRRV